MSEILGLYSDEVTSSSFNRKRTCTSPFLLKSVCDKMHIPIDVEYYYTVSGSSASMFGSHDYPIPESVTIIEHMSSSEGELYYVETDLDLVPSRDFLDVGGTLVEIKAYTKNLIQLDPGANLATGVYGVFRTNSLIPRSDNILKSAFTVYTTALEYEEQLRRVVTRLTPLRCHSVSDVVNSLFSDEINFLEDSIVLDYSVDGVINNIPSSSAPIYPVRITINFWEGAMTYLYFYAHNTSGVQVVLDESGFVNIVNPTIVGLRHGAFQFIVPEDYTGPTKYISGHVDFIASSTGSLSQIVSRPFILELLEYDGTIIPLQIEESPIHVYDSFDLDF